VGFGAVAGHVVMFLAVFSAGILVAGAVNNSMSAQIEARNEHADRLRAGANAAYDLTSSNYTAGADRTYANFTNDGSEEVDLDDVTLLVDGTRQSHDQVQRFQIRSNASSDAWLPGEVLEIVTEGRGDVDVTIAGPYGVTGHRRN
jgi:archaellum component FlaF (FlaF/FlaG flagellin family)